MDMHLFQACATACLVSQSCLSFYLNSTADLCVWFVTTSSSHNSAGPLTYHVKNTDKVSCFIVSINQLSSVKYRLILLRNYLRHLLQIFNFFVKILFFPYLKLFVSRYVRCFYRLSYVYQFALDTYNCLICFFSSYIL